MNMVREATSIFSFGVTTIFGNPGSIEPPFFRDFPEDFAYVPVLMYPLGLVYAMTIGPQSTPPTVLVGALLLVIGGGWMAWSVMREPSRQLGADVQPRVQ